MNGAEGLVTNDTELAEVLSAFFPLVLTAKTSFQKSQTPDTKEKVWNKEVLLSVEESYIRERINETDICMLMDLDALHPCMATLNYL